MGRLSLSNSIVRAEPWQIFFVFLGVIVFFTIIPEEQESLKVIATILLAASIFGWLLILGRSLNENLPEDQQKPDIVFIGSCFYCILLVCVSAILKSVPMDNDMILYAVFFVVSFMVSFFYIIYFVSMLFVQNQDIFLNKEKLKAEAVFLLFIVFIVGVLWLQSRVKKFFPET